MDLLINHQLLQLRHEKVPITQRQHQLRRTAQKHTHELDQNLQKTILRSQIVQNQLISIRRTQPFLQASCRHATVQAVRSLPDDHQTS